MIFAGNHHSHLDTPVVLTSIPEPWRHQMFVGAAADYFFRTRVTSAVSALVIGAIPIERSKVTRRSADQAAELHRRRLVDADLPRGRPLARRLGPALPGRRRLPGQPLRRARRARSTSRAPTRILRKGTKLPNAGQRARHLRRPAAARADGESAARFAERIEQAVAALADEATTDWWQARQRAATGTTPALTGPDAPAWRRAWALGDRSRKRKRQSRTWPKL